MQPTDSQSLAALRDAIAAFFADPPADALDATIGFARVRGRPSGIGGLIGMDAEVAGEVFGRRLEATVTIALRAADTATLDTDTQTATDAVLGASRDTQLARGLLSVILDQAGPVVLEDGGDARRELAFHVLFEHIRRPDTAGDVIDLIPLDDTVIVAEASEPPP